MENRIRRKNDEQIQEAIDLLLKLKDKLPKRDSFGGDNHALIDLQIKVLNRELLEKDIWSYGDSIASQLLDVIEWKRGERDEWFNDLVDEF